MNSMILLELFAGLTAYAIATVAERYIVEEWADHTFEAWENVYLLDDYGIVEHIPRKVIEAHEVVIA